MQKVNLIATLPSERSVSMERYVVEVERSVSSVSDIEIDTLRLDDSESIPVANAIEKVKRYYRRYCEYPRVLRERSSDGVFHIIDHSYSYLVGRIAAPTVVTCHDIMLLTRSDWQKNQKWTPAVPLFRWSINHLRRASYVIAVSERTRRDLLHHNLVDDDRIAVIPPSIDPLFIENPTVSNGEIRARLGIPNNTVLILHVGTPGRYKNVETVVQVLAELRRRGVDASVLRVGRHVDDSLAATVRSLGLNPFFYETGPLPDDELAKCYREADVLLFPSWKEGFGWPVVEAMASGLPVVASKADAITESLGGCGIQLDAGDVGGFSNAIARLRDNRDERGAQVELGLARSLRFHRSTTGSEILGVYQLLWSH